MVLTLRHNRVPTSWVPGGQTLFLVCNDGCQGVRLCSWFLAGDEKPKTKSDPETGRDCQVTNTHVKRWKEHRHEIGYGHLYQGRYKCFPVATEDYFYQVVRYVERNALRANLVERAESWGWSSLRRVEREDPAFPTLTTWPLPRPTDWLQIVNQPQTEAEVEALRCCVNLGRLLGDPNWVTDTAKRLGLECTVRPRGRPKKQS